MDRVLAERRVISGQLSGVLSQLVQRGVGHAYQVERMQLLVRAEELQQQLSRNVAMEEQAAGIVKVWSQLPGLSACRLWVTRVEPAASRRIDVTGHAKDTLLRL